MHANVATVAENHLVAGLWIEWAAHAACNRIVVSYKLEEKVLIKIVDYCLKKKFKKLIEYSENFTNYLLISWLLYVFLIMINSVLSWSCLFKLKNMNYRDFTWNYGLNFVSLIFLWKVSLIYVYFFCFWL